MRFVGKLLVSQADIENKKIEVLEKECYCTFDERLIEIHNKNKAIKDEIQSNIFEHTDIKEGSFIYVDGEIKRVAIILYEEDGVIRLQTGGGSYSIGKSGVCSYSGGPDYGIAVKQKGKRSRQKGSCWFFSNNERKAHNGVYTELMFPVREVELVK